MKVSKVLRADEMKKCLGCFTCMNICSIVNHKSHSLTKSAIKIRTSGGIAGRFVGIVCLACENDRACAESCPSGALEKRAGGGVKFISEKCIGCGSCEQACIVNAVHWDETEDRPIICKHCGACARFCPHDCLRMEEVGNDL